MVRDWGKNREAAVRSRGQVSSRRLTLSNGVMDKWQEMEPVSSKQTGKHAAERRTKALISESRGLSGWWTSTVSFLVTLLWTVGWYMKWGGVCELSLRSWSWVGRRKCSWEVKTVQQLIENYLSKLISMENLLRW